jgi:SAM-dependent methyltransferase
MHEQLIGEWPCGIAAGRRSVPDPLDDPRTTSERAGLIREKPLLQRFYRESYDFFSEVSRHAPPGPKLELGSGAGFIKEILPGAITSDVMRIGGIDIYAAAERLPFADQSLAAIFLLNVLHHVPDAESFFGEARRCLKPGGIIAMVEPANTPLARLIYTHFHHEPFLPDASDWRFVDGCPLSMANGALPWIVFVRDRRRFTAQFPELQVRKVEYRYPLTYLLSGGFSYPQMVPRRLCNLVGAAERLLAPANAWLGLFMRIVVTKR